MSSRLGGCLERAASVEAYKESTPRVDHLLGRAREPLAPQPVASGRLADESGMIDIASDVLIDGVQLAVLLFNVWEFICVDLLLRCTAALAGIGTGGGGAREAGSEALL